MLITQLRLRFLFGNKVSGLDGIIEQGTTLFAALMISGTTRVRDEIMFSKVLIANRGAIACRVIRTLKKLNIGSVAVYSEADSQSLHVVGADEAFTLGKGGATETYLDQEKIIAIAKKSGAQAIHPGYGFLSENPKFVERCEQEGLIFLGPTAEQMLSFGLKHSARNIATQALVPLLPGTDLLNDKQQALLEADNIGYPVMLKSTAGGGGSVCNAVFLVMNFLKLLIVLNALVRITLAIVEFFLKNSFKKHDISKCKFLVMVQGM